MDAKELRRALVEMQRRSFEENKRTQEEVAAGDRGAVSLLGSICRAEADVLLESADERMRLYLESEGRDTYSLRVAVDGMRAAGEKLNEAINAFESLLGDPHESVLREAGIEDRKP